MDTGKFQALLNRLEGYVVGLENQSGTDNPAQLMARLEDLVVRAENAKPGAGSAIKA